MIYIHSSFGLQSFQHCEGQSVGVYRQQPLVRLSPLSDNDAAMHLRWIAFQALASVPDFKEKVGAYQGDYYDYIQNLLGETPHGFYPLRVDGASLDAEAIELGLWKCLYWQMSDGSAVILFRETVNLAIWPDARLLNNS